MNAAAADTRRLPPRRRRGAWRTRLPRLREERREQMAAVQLAVTGAGTNEGLPASQHRRQHRAPQQIPGVLFTRMHVYRREVREGGGWRTVA